MTTISYRLKHKWSNRTIDYVYNHLTLQELELGTITGTSAMKWHLSYSYCWLFIASYFRKRVGAGIIVPRAGIILPGSTDIMVYVHSNFRRLGIGSDLLARMVKVAEECKYSELKVYPWNDVATNFYNSNRFLSNFVGITIYNKLVETESL